MDKSLFEQIISFLQGSIFGLAIVGAFFILINLLWIGINFALIVTFFYIIFCSLIVLFLQSVLAKIELLNESKKQTKLLEKIEQKLNKDEKLLHNRP